MLTGNDVLRLLAAVLALAGSIFIVAVVLAIHNGILRWDF